MRNRGIKDATTVKMTHLSSGVQCPAKGEEFQEAGTPCQLTCADLSSGISPICDSSATVEGCNCLPGSVLVY